LILLQLTRFAKYYYGDEIKEYETGGHVARMGAMRNKYNKFGRKSSKEEFTSNT